MEKDKVENSVASHGSTDNGAWYPLFGLIEQGEDIPIMVESRGESHAATSLRFQRLMADHGFELEDGWIVKEMQTARFIKTMEQAGWVKQFIAFGP